MASDEVVERIRVLRGQGRSPKQIARALGMAPAAVAPLVRTIAAEDGTRRAAPALAGCWVSPDWAAGLTVQARPGWPGLPAPAESGTSGMVTVAVAREQGGSKVSACAYLVDTYCMGVKNAMGPRAMDRRKLPGFISQTFRSYSDPPLAAPLELAQDLVFGGIEYACGTHPENPGGQGGAGQVRLRRRFCFRQVVQDGVLVDVGGLARIFGLMAGHANPVDRAQDGTHRGPGLCLHGMHDLTPSAKPHPDAADVLSLIGKHHPDKQIAKAARRSSYKAASRRRRGYEQESWNRP